MLRFFRMFYIQRTYSHDYITNCDGLHSNFRHQSVLANTLNRCKGSSLKVHITALLVSQKLSWSQFPAHTYTIHFLLKTPRVSSQTPFRKVILPRTRVWSRWRTSASRWRLELCILDVFHCLSSMNLRVRGMLCFMCKRFTTLNARSCTCDPAGLVKRTGTNCNK